MAEVAPDRSNLLVEETQFRGAVSEALLQKTAASINFINGFQHNFHTFHLNGPYLKFTAPFPGVDGIFPCLFNMEVVGVSYYNGVSGSSGNTIVDIHRISSSGADNGTIFSTRPQISDSAASESFTVIDLVTPQSFVPAGHTAAVFNQTTFNAGDALRLDLDSAMSGGQNFQLGLFYRPLS